MAYIQGADRQQITFFPETIDDYFSLEHFNYDKEQNHYICPAGQKLYASKSGN